MRCPPKVLTSSPRPILPYHTCLPTHKLAINGNNTFNLPYNFSNPVSEYLFKSFWVKDRKETIKTQYIC